MVNRCLYYKLKLPTRDLIVSVIHTLGKAIICLNYKCIDYSYFFFNKTFTLLLSDTFIKITIKLTTNGYNYEIEATPCKNIIEFKD